MARGNGQANQIRIEGDAMTAKGPKNNQGVEASSGGGFMCTGPGIDQFTIATLISGIKFELACPGMKLTRDPKCTTRARRMFPSIKTNKPLEIMNALEEILAGVKIGKFPPGYQKRGNASDY